MNIRKIVKIVEVDLDIQGDAELVRVEVVEHSPTDFEAWLYVFRDVDVTFTYPHDDDPPSVGMWIHFPVKVAECANPDDAVQAAIAAITK